MHEIVKLLQDISNFKPERLEYKSIFESFISSRKCNWSCSYC